jgi:hypothetical protein
MPAAVRFIILLLDTHAQGEVSVTAVEQVL